MINEQLVGLTSRLHTCSAAEDANDRGEVFLIISIESLNAAHHLLSSSSSQQVSDTLNGIKVIQRVEKTHAFGALVTQEPYITKRESSMKQKSCKTDQRLPRQRFR